MSPGESYSGPPGGLKKDSPWLASEDVGTLEMRVQIEDVLRHRNVKFEAGRVEAKVGTLKFTGIEKQMILNATNRKMLGRLFGLDAGNWRTQWVVLYVDGNVKQVGGGIGNGLRIKEAPPAPPEPTSKLTNLPAAWLDWDNEQRGVFISNRGLAQLEIFWSELSKSDRAALKEKLPEWKATAEGVK